MGHSREEEASAQGSTLGQAENILVGSSVVNLREASEL